MAIAASTVPRRTNLAAVTTLNGERIATRFQHPFTESGPNSTAAAAAWACRAWAMNEQLSGVLVNKS